MTDTPAHATIHAEKAVAREITPAERMFDQLMSSPPDEIPEVLRLVTMVDGAADQVHIRVEQLVERVAHLLRLPFPEPTPTGRPVIECDTPLGRRLDMTLATLSRSCAQLEDLLQRLAV